jgi:serine/threonine protein kinase
MALQTGEQFGHYTIQSHMAEGGTGDVYRATDTLTGRDVALKIPSRATIVNADQYDYFLRELDALNILEHPAVQRKLESGRYGDTPFLATEWVEGQSLRHMLKEHGAFSVDQALALMRKIAIGVAYCHAQGVIHRDLKPENILFVGDEQPVIIDFGLSLSHARRASGKAAGTPEYAAPEQVEGRRGDERTDFYSLGIILYELIAGKTPFEGDDMVSVMNMRLHAAPPRLDMVQSGVPRSIATVVAKCLQRDPDQRYPDVQALLTDLDYPDKVDTSTLEALSVAPPKPSFFQTQPGQAILTTAAFILGIALLTIVLIALKH